MFRRTVDSLVEHAKTMKRGGRPLAEDSSVRQKLAQAHVELEVFRLNNLRALSQLMKTGMPGPEASIQKLYWSEYNQRLCQAAMEILGPQAQLSEFDGGSWAYNYLRARGNTIEAGTSEVQRNVIAQRKCPMEFDLSDTQKMMQQAARAFLSKKCPTSRVRSIMDTETAFDSELWNGIAEQGWLAITLPESVGGLELGIVEVAVTAEEAGRACLPGPWLANLWASSLLQSCDASPKRDALLQAMATGEAIATVALLEESAEWSLDGVQLTARRTEDGFVLDGSKRFVLDAAVADHILVVARTDQGHAILVVDREAAGVSINPTPGIDATRKLNDVTFEGVQVPADACLMAGEDLEPRWQRAADIATVATCAELLGVMQWVLETTVEYAQSRQQFGKAIGSFQAVQNRCADMLLLLESSRSATYYAAWMLTENHPEASSAASIAKTYCSDAARVLCDHGMQVHGGIGFTWEHDLQLYYKRAKASEILLGDACYHRERRFLRQPSSHLGHVEWLESRELLTVTSSFIAGTLSVSSDADDDIAITQDGTNVLISVNGAPGINPGGGPVVAANTVTNLQINGFTGNFDNTVDLTQMLPSLFTSLQTVDVDAGNGNDTTRLGLDINTSLGQTYADAVVLTADVALKSSGGGDLRLLGTIDSNGGVARGLSLNTTGVTGFGDGGADYIGSINPLKHLVAFSTSETVFNVADTVQPTVTTTLGQTYEGPLVLASDVHLSSNGFFFYGTIDSQDATARSLLLDGGILSGGFSDNIGSNFALANLTSNTTAELVVNAGLSFHTTGDQTFNHNLLLQGAGIEFVADLGTVTFGGSVTGTPATALVDANKIIINGDGGDDTVTLGHTGGVPSFTFDGVTHVLYPNTTMFEFNGGGGDDALVVNYAGGNPIPTGGLIYDGGAQGPNGDRLAFFGNGNTVSYQPSATTAGAGKVTVSGRTVDFTGLEPVDITGMATVNITPAGADDVLTVANGFDFATGAIPALRVSGTTNGAPIETVALWNNTTVSINKSTNNGNDTITIASANNAHGNANFNIVTGTGTDKIDVNGSVVVTGDVNFASQQINLTNSISATNVALNSGAGAIADLNAAAINILALNFVATAGTGIEADTTVDVINASVTGAGGINLRETDAVVLINATTANGDIDVISGGAMTATNVVAGGTAHDVDLETTSGNISVSKVNALSDTVRLTTPGSITDGNGAAVNVSAGSLVAIAATGINLDTAVDQIDASVLATGAVLFREADAVVLNNVTTTDGDIDVVSGGAMTATFVSAGGAGHDTDLETTGGGIAVVVANAVDQVRLTAATNITDTNPATPNVTANSLVATAVSGITLVTDVALIDARTTGTGAIVLEEVNAVTLNPVQTADGLIDIVAGGTITATLVTAGGSSRNVSIRSTGGGIGVDSVSAIADRIDLTAAASITDLNGGAVNLNSRIAILIAGGGIGTTADPLETTINELEAASGPGGVFLENAGTLIVGKITPTVGISATSGDIDIMTTGAMFILEDIVTTTGDIRLSTGESAGPGEQLVLANKAKILSTSGDIFLSAGDDVDLHMQTRVATSGQLFIASDVGDLDAQGTFIKLDGEIATQFVDMVAGDDDDKLIINETLANQFIFSAIAPNSHTNAAFQASGRAPGNVGMHFEGGLGNDSMEIYFTLPQDVAYFSDTNEPNSGVINVLNNYTMSFDGLAPLHLSGATGSLLIDATSTPDTTFLNLDDNAIPDDGFMVVSADGGVEQTTFGGFTNLTLRGGDGTETFNVLGFDTTKPLGLGGPLAHVYLDGSNTQGTDAAGDVFNVRVLPGNIGLHIFGGLGNDLINVSSDAPTNLGSIDPIEGPVYVDGQGGSDTLVVNDKGDPADDVATLTSSTLTGMGLASGISYANIDQLDVFFGLGRDELFLMLPLPSPVQPPLPSLIRIQGGPHDQDRLTVIGTNNPDVADEAIVGTFGSSSPIQIQEVEQLQMFGYAGPDRFINNTAVPSFLVGGDGPDTLQGGSSIDSIFGGGDLDQLFGNDADDYLYPDHDIVGGLLVERITDGDVIDGGNGFDSVLALGFGDLLRFISQSIDNGSIQDVITWLRGQFIPDTPAGRTALLNAGLVYSNSGSIADPAQVPAPPPVVDLSGVVFDPNLFVQRAYFDYLDRDPALDPGGVQQFTAKVVAGATIEQIRSEILGSAEYFGKGGNTTNAGFIANLYADLLLRPASQSDINTWLGVLANGASRADVALLILVTPEARNVQIGEIYDHLDDVLFNGIAPPPGANDVDRLAMLADFANGLTIVQAERQLRAAALAGKLYADSGVGQESSFVVDLYRSPAVLGREPTDAELAPWLTALANGTMSRKFVAFSILSSVEKRTRDVQQIYQNFLGRGVDPPTLDYALAFLNTGGRIEALEVGRALLARSLSSPPR
ncbi:Acyl-CoA dehydrogenase IpdE2 (5OH-HIP-CoA dehydrogenase beta subunit) [Durusdinium trenchii]|uniref:Acyl-CoA dehydrogenase IpdE2 (5OH-HIP-CoA dehydrogenase beta subunit) n=1 Tax=Durusdinium trenchii TaxID=1381693 RepID=A0ABP0QTH6_9DINO